MALDKVKIGELEISKLTLGSNPVSGYSHLSAEKDQEMMRYFTVANIKKMLKQAEELGVTTYNGRADHHVKRLLMEYWDEGGKIDWIGQTCPELGEMRKGVENAINGGARACYLHGGHMDYLLANGKLEETKPDIARIKEAGLAAGIAGHLPAVFEWAEKNLELDFYMCSYYNPIPRTDNPEHQHGYDENFDDADRERMVALIKDLSKPAIHYKVLASSRNNPKDAFAFVAKHLRAQDAVCVGVYPGNNPNELAEDVRLLEEALV